MMTLSPGATRRAAVESGERSADALARVMRTVVETEEDLVHLDYAVAVDAVTLLEQTHLDDPTTVRLLIAAQVGPVRLIDNSAALHAAVHRAAALDRQLERIG